MLKADFEWEWTTVHQASFDRLKQAMINATHLSAIDPRQPYHLYTDASKDCVGATLVKPDLVVRSRGRSGMGSNIAWHRRHNDVHRS